MVMHASFSIALLESVVVRTSPFVFSYNGVKRSGRPGEWREN